MMTSPETLTVCLLLALTSNAVLLAMLLLKSPSSPRFFGETLPTLQQASHVVSSSDFTHSEPLFSPGLSSSQVKQETNIEECKLCLNSLNNIEEDRATNREQQPLLVSNANVNLHDLKMRETNEHHRLNYGIKLTQVLLNLLQKYTGDNLQTKVKNNVTKSFQNRRKRFSQIKKVKSKSERKQRIVYKNITLPTHAQTEEERNRQGNTRLLNLQEATSSLRRSKKEAELLENINSSAREAVLDIHGVFSSLTDTELARFDVPVYDLLIPALVHFESMVLRGMEGLQSLIISHDLRLEVVEKFMLNALRGSDGEPQSDFSDNKSEPDIPAQLLAKAEGFLPIRGNDSSISEIHLDLGGSGDSVWEHPSLTTAPTSVQPTTLHNVALHDINRILSTLEQKVLALENYNVMSDSELSRVRSEVVKMDDKVTELDRKERNLQIRTTMHTQKITELEVYMGKSELGIHTALDSYGRVSSRLESFKDKLAEFKNDLQAVAVQFVRQDQIASELRAADSYKAHDIQEIRKSMFGIEGRLNGLYRVLDQNLDTVKTDLRTMLDRMCMNNKLAC